MVRRNRPRLHPSTSIQVHHSFVILLFKYTWWPGCGLGAVSDFPDMNVSQYLSYEWNKCKMCAVFEHLCCDMPSDFETRGPMFRDVILLLRAGTHRWLRVPWTASVHHLLTHALSLQRCGRVSLLASYFLIAFSVLNIPFNISFSDTFNRKIAS
jgi:hypothetical protein